MTTFRNVSWWMLWLAIVALFGVQVFDIKQDDIAYQNIKEAIRARPYEVLEKLNEMQAELDRRAALWEQLRERGLVTSGGKCARCDGKL